MTTRLGHIHKVELGFNDRNSLVLTFNLNMKEYIWWDDNNNIRTDYKEDVELSESGTFLMWDVTAPNFGKDLEKLLRKAKVHSLDKLEGVPIEATVKDGVTVSWRILEEVL